MTRFPRGFQLLPKTGAFRRALSAAAVALLWIGVLQAVASGARAQQPNPVLTPAQYDRALAAVAQAVRRQVELEGTGNVGSGPYPDQAVQPILHCQVRDPAGRWLVTVNNQPLQDSIANVEAMSGSNQRRGGYRALLAQIALLRTNDLQSAQAWMASGAKASVAQILSAPEYSSQPIPPPSKLELMVDRFGRWLSRLMRRFHGPSAPNVAVNPLVPQIILWAIGILAGGILLAYLISAISRHMSNKAAVLAPESSLAMTAQEASLVATRDYDRLLALARNHAESQDYRAALRLVYLASLVVLDAQGIVRLNRSKTNWEYLSIVRSSGLENLYVELLPMTRSFDRIWYGVQPAQAADYESALKGHQEIRRILVSVSEQAARPARATA